MNDFPNGSAQMESNPGSGVLSTGLDDRTLQAMLIGCRLELQTLRRDFPVKDYEIEESGLGLVERRLRRVVGRLETAAAALSGKLERAAGSGGTDAAWLVQREADIRVKNSLEIITSILEKQAGAAQAAEARLALQAAHARIGAVTRVHASLRENVLNGRIDLRTYLEPICVENARAFGAEERGIGLRVDLQPLAVQPETARAIGIIVTELLTNAVRHAFPHEHGGTVRVTSTIAGSFYSLNVADDGVGLPCQGNTPLEPRTGLVLVNALAAQVRVSLLVDVTRGTRYTLSMPV